MINCNPETVSTDYDTSDRLYFEPLTYEDVLNIVERERTKGELLGVIVQFGGQTPLNLADSLQAAGVPIMGTSPNAIDLAEDRDRFGELLDRSGDPFAGKRHSALGRGCCRGGGSDWISGCGSALLCAGRARDGHCG